MITPHEGREMLVSMLGDLAERVFPDTAFGWEGASHRKRTSDSSLSKAFSEPTSPRSTAAVE